MNIKLLNLLIERGLVKVGTEVDANVEVKIFCQEQCKVEERHFMITKINKVGNSYNFDVASSYDGTKSKLDGESILTLDGMDPVRYAAVFNIIAV